MEKLRLNNLQLVVIYLVLALAYIIYYLPFLPKIFLEYILVYVFLSPAGPAAARILDFIGYL